LFQEKHNIGKVLALEGEYALVLHERFDPCLLCPGDDDCHEKEQHECSLELRARNEARASVGDLVHLRITDESQILRVILHVYGIPLCMLVLGLLGGIGLAQVSGASSGLQSVVGLIGLMLALGLSVPLSRRLNRRAYETGRFTPVVAEIASPARLEV
jgi:positive regulator of sigma E activity